MKDINKNGFVIVIGDCFFKNKKHSYDDDVAGDLRFAKVFKTREKAQKEIDDHPTWKCRIEPISEFLVVGYTLIDDKVVEIDCFKISHSLYATIGKKMRGWDDVNEIYKVYETKAACIKAEINSLKNTIQYHKIKIRENQKEIKNAEKTMKKLKAAK